jgi:CSLREA domain-containing protein
MTHHRFPTRNVRKPRAGQPRRWRPQLELLEDRTAPAVFVVNSLTDTSATDGQLTLREAIQAATTNTSVDGSPTGETGPDLIVFAQSILGGTIILTQGELTLDGGGDLSIVGPSNNNPTGIKISGNNASRIFNITNTSNSVLLRNLTLTGGNAAGDNGGAILNDGQDTTLNTVTIENSTAGFGGAIRNDDNGTSNAVLTVINSRFINNLSTAFGGAINNNNATLTVTDSTFARNTSGSGGGALLNFGTNGQATISGTTFQGNATNDGPGGGIFNIANNANALGLFNSTIVSNVSSGASAQGGGLASNTGTISLVHVTIVGNTDTSNNANSAGGVSRTGGTINAVNTVISRNFSGNATQPNINDPATITNVINGTNTTNFITLDNANNPGLGGLADNGGETLTLLPLTGSALLDAGTNGQNGPDGTPLTTDQRGFPRQVGPNVDIGAVERFDPSTMVTLEVLQDGTTVTSTSTARPVTLRATVTSGTTGIMPTGSVNFYRDPDPADPTDTPIQLNSTPIALDDMGMASLPNVPLSATSALFARFVPSSPAFDPSTSETDTITATIQSTVGVFDPSGVYQLLNQNMTTTTGPDFSYSFGIPGDQPVVGNWTGSMSGVKLPGVVRNVGGLLQWTLADENPPVLPNLDPFFFGLAGETPVSGDWNGSDTDGIGVYNPASGQWQLRNSPTGTGGPEFTFSFGGPGFVPVVGDWNGDGTDTVGVYNPTSGQWILAGNNPATGFPTPFGAAFNFGGQAGSRPVAGDWDGNGTDGIGVFFPQAGADAGFGGFLLRNTPDAGAADVNGGAVILAGLDFWLPVTGNWGVAPTTSNELLAPPPMMMPLTLGEGGVPGGQSINALQLQSIVDGALGRLASAGADPAVLNALIETQFVLADLPSATLGLADVANGRVLIDVDGAGAGWYVDGTPWEDGEFAAGGVSGVDLLSAVLHEMGHVAGHGHDADGLMAETLSAGVRHTEALDALFGWGLGEPGLDTGEVAVP